MSIKSIRRVRSGTVTTTDTTLTTILTHPMPNDSIGYFRAVITAKDLNSVNGFGDLEEFVVKNISGTTSIVANPVSGGSGNSFMNGCVVSVVFSGGNILVRVNGIAAKTIEWDCHSELVLNEIPSS